MGSPILTAGRLHELLAYDADTGIFTRRISQTNRVKVGDVAGSPNQKGYINIMVDGRLYPAHRLSWLYVHGEWPQAQIDHLNGVRDDNRIANLREATNGQNKQNMRAARADNGSGLLGVRWHERDQRWHARIMLDGKAQHLGSFGTSDEAQAAYLAAKRQLHEFGEIAKEAGASISAS